MEVEVVEVVQVKVVASQKGACEGEMDQQSKGVKWKRERAHGKAHAW